MDKANIRRGSVSYRCNSACAPVQSLDKEGERERTVINVPLQKNLSVAIKCISRRPPSFFLHVQPWIMLQVTTVHYEVAVDFLSKEEEEGEKIKILPPTRVK